MINTLSISIVLGMHNKVHSLHTYRRAANPYDSALVTTILTA